MFYAISKRRRDINAAEARGREEGRRQARLAMLAAISDRLDNGADPLAIIAELRAQSRPENCRPE